MAIILPTSKRILTRQPQGIVRLSDLAIDSGILLASSGNKYCLNNGINGVFNGNYALSTGRDGKAVYIQGGSDQIAICNYAGLTSGSDPFTLETLVDITSTAYGALLFGFSVDARTTGGVGESGNYGTDRAIFIFPSSNSCRVWGWGIDWTTSYTFTANTKIHVAVVKGAGTTADLKLYINGVLVDSTTGTSTWTTSGPYFYFGGRHYAYSSTCVAKYYMGSAYKTALSAETIASHAANPWQIFEQPDNRIYFAQSTATTHATTGDLIGGGATIAGSANRTRAHATTGALSNSGATIAGIARHNIPHPTTGALSTTGAVITGSARHNIPHPTSGVLSTSGAVITGAADRQPPGAITHATTGALTGQGATVSGTANRTRAHATSGVLSGQGAIIVGSAQHKALHTTSGTLSGQGASIVGAAARAGAPVVHATLGDLIGQGAALSGSALRSGASILTPQDLINIADVVWGKIIETLTAEEILRVMLAALAGKTTGVGTSTEHYLSKDGTKDRIIATFDANNNRITVDLDGTE